MLYEKDKKTERHIFSNEIMMFDYFKEKLSIDDIYIKQAVTNGYLIKNDYLIFSSLVIIAITLPELTKLNIELGLDVSECGKKLDIAIQLMTCSQIEQLINVCTKNNLVKPINPKKKG